MGKDYPYRPPVSEWAGTETVVRDDSKKNLPTDKDRTKETPLPPEAATPNSPSSGGGENMEDHGADIPRYVSIRPDNDIDKRPRTLPQPGEEYGTPTKYDYNMPTRRSLTAEYALFDWMYEPWEKVAWKRQRRQKGMDKRKSQLRYKKNKNRYRQKAKQYRQKNKQKIKRYNRRRQRNPQQHKRRRGTVLTAPEIMFAIGPDDFGYVHGVSPLTAMVTFATKSGSWASLPVVVFLSSVAFITDEDIDAMFALIDAVIGLEAYDDLTPDAVRGCAELFGIDWDGDADFKEHCQTLTGVSTLDDMTVDQLEMIDEALVHGDMGSIAEGVFEMTTRTMDDDDDEGNPYEVDPDDDALYYGEVNLLEYRKLAGDVFLYDQDYEVDPEIKHPEEGDLMFDPTGQEEYKRKPTQQHLPPAPGGGQYDDRNDNNSQPGSRVVNRGEGPSGFIQGPMTYPKAAATIPQIMANTIAPVHNRSRSLPAKLVYARPDTGYWRFEIRGKTDTYTVKVKGLKKGNTRYMKKAPVLVSCSCPFWRWQGPEHWGQRNGYLLGTPRGTASFPIIRDPDEGHWACKHVLSAFRLAQNYRIANNGEFWWGTEGGVIPVQDMKLAGMQFRKLKSPLKYMRASNVQRLALCDTSVSEPPDKHDTYFAEIEQWRTRGRGGRKLKKPVLEEIIRGVDDNCIVGFLDYHKMGENYWYIDYLKTRQDKRGAGYARKLVEEFYKEFAKPGGTIHWGKMMREEVGHLKDSMAKKYPEVDSIGAVYW